MERNSRYTETLGDTEFKIKTDIKFPGGENLWILEKHKI